jgi:hypothetical protein
MPTGLWQQGGSTVTDTPPWWQYCPLAIAWLVLYMYVTRECKVGCFEYLLFKALPPRHHRNRALPSPGCADDGNAVLTVQRARLTAIHGAVNSAQHFQR